MRLYEWPQCGVFLVIKRRLWVLTSNQASTNVEAPVSEQQVLWNRVVASQADRKRSAGFYPRGRVEYRAATCRFVIVLDPCLLKDCRTISSVIEAFRLPVSGTDWEISGEYRCSRCWMRKQLHRYTAEK